MPSVELAAILSQRVVSAKSSPIRDILKLTENKNVISLNGGYPSPESFPLDRIKEISSRVWDKGSEVLQYQKTEGYQPLLDVLPDFLARKNRQVISTPENIAVSAGSQEALDIIGRMLIDSGDKVAVESPTYLGALQAFNPNQPQYIEIETDQDGIIPEKLEEAFIRDPDIKFLYTIPTFQNPTGRTIPLERRKQIADILKRYGKLAVEDDPYSEIRFEGEDLPSIQSMAPENVLHLFTFSKTLAPGFRIGGMVGPKPFVEAFNKIKQGMVLYTSGVNQAIVAEYIRGGYLDEQIPVIRDIYRPRRDAMAQVVSESFPGIFEFNVSQGGLFIWVQLKPEAAQLADRFDIKQILDQAINAGVSFVPGAAFFANSTGNEIAMRLNFSNQPEDKIVAGVRTIGEILNSRLG